MRHQRRPDTNKRNATVVVTIFGNDTESEITSSRAIRKAEMILSSYGCCAVPDHICSLHYFVIQVIINKYIYLNDEYLKKKLIYHDIVKIIYFINF